MKKRRKKIVRKAKAGPGLFGLFRRSRPRESEALTIEGEAPPPPAGEPGLDNSTLRLPVLSDDSGELEVAPGPPPRDSELQTGLPRDEVARSRDLTSPTSPEKGATQPAAAAYRRASAKEQQRRSLARPKWQGRVEESRKSRNEGGLFSFLFSLIGLVIRMAIVVVLVGAIGAFIGYEVVRAYVRTEEVVVPNVRGMKVPDALDVLGQKKLGLLKERVEPNTLVAPGEIIEQKPPPGGKAKQGTLVRVVVSSGRANYIVPDVVGERRDNAENKIRGAGLDVGDISYLESETVPRDCVISQNPEPNKGLEKPEPVHLLLSKGPPKTPAPTQPTPANTAPTP